MRELQIATYNVRVDTEVDNNWSWDYRKQEVINLINYHNWDVFGVQEIRPNQVEDLSTLEGYMSYTKEREGDSLGEGLGIYFKPEVFDLLDKGHFWLSKTPYEPSIHPEAGCKRIALWVVLKEKISNKEILIINTHLDHISDVARKEGMAVLLKELADKIDKYQTILLGDFNAEPSEILHDELKKQFSYPEDEKIVFVYGPKGTFQDFNYDIPWSELEQIDYILFKEIKSVRYGVLTDSCDRKFPSDHFPVVATFNI